MESTLLCLHGWGGSQASFDPLRRALARSGITILCPDLPGFGGEPEPKTPWTVDDYAQWAEEYAKKHTSSPLLLLGHSHGGRIAIKMAVRGNVPIRHLFLAASAGIRHGRHLKRLIGLSAAKIGRAVLQIPGLRSLEPLSRKLLYKVLREHDYERASPLMQETLRLVTREDLSPLLHRIHVPTDIFWGEDDGQTPVRDAHLMHTRIQESTLHVYPGVRHAVHKDRAEELATIIRQAL